MAKRATKEIILNVALELFSVSGYQGVSVADIAEATGIKAASLYKHYKSKQAIFDAILAKATAEYQMMANQLGVDGLDSDNDIANYERMELEELINIGQAMFHYFLHDETAQRLRRMLTIEQYQNPTVSQLFTQQYIREPLLYQSSLFGVFIKQGLMKEVESQVMAMHFYAPIYLLLCLCDNDPLAEKEAHVILKRHIIQFNQLYRKETK